MDCQLGKAISQNRLPDHIQMGTDKTIEFLSENLELSQEEKENIIHCVKQRHGVKSFYSLEAEICCNADCYRFMSVRRIIATIRYFRKADLDDIVVLLKQKAYEK